MDNASRSDTPTLGDSTDQVSPGGSTDSVKIVYKNIDQNGEDAHQMAHEDLRKCPSDSVNQSSTQSPSTPTREHYIDTRGHPSLRAQNSLTTDTCTGWYL